MKMLFLIGKEFICIICHTQENNVHKITENISKHAHGSIPKSKEVRYFQ
jgi:hypothetical protein